VRAILIAIGLVVAFALIGIIRRSLFLCRLARSRKGEEFPDFSASFGASNVPVAIQRNVFEYIQKSSSSGLSRFPIRAEDPFDLHLGDVDDLEDAINELANACGKERPLLNIWKGQPISTVGDLARLIAHLPTPDEVRVEGSRRLWTDQ
jgi:hypothetical protein